MSLTYKVHNIAGTAFSIPYSNVAQVIEANPYDKMRGVNQYIQLLNGTLYVVGTPRLIVAETNSQMLKTEVGAVNPLDQSEP
jgi:hypothetical protein